MAFILERNARHIVEVLKDADTANRRGRQNGASATGCLAFIVQADIAAHDRKIERTAGFAHAFQTPHELRHDFRALGVGEIETIGHRQRARAHGVEIAIGLRNSLLAAFIRIGIAIARVAIGRDCQRLVRAMDPHHS